MDELKINAFIATILPAYHHVGFCLSEVQGLTATSIKIDSPIGSALLRPRTQQSDILGTSRDKEAAYLRCGAPLISPHVLANADDYLVISWIEGDVLTQSQFQDTQYQQQLAHSLAALHQGKGGGYPLDLSAQFERCWQHIDRRRLTPRWLAWHQYFQRHPMPTPLKLAPLHMDIHYENLVLTKENQLALIDWEYGCDGDIALELCAYFSANPLDESQRWQFLTEYSQQGYSDIHALQRQISAWQPWVTYMQLMWYEVRYQQSGDQLFADIASQFRDKLNID